jgi:hypothetical protein
VRIPSITNANPRIGESFPSFAEPFRQAACQVRQANPGYFRSIQPGLAVAAGPALLADGFWDNLCPDYPPPPDPGDRPLIGGQCPVVYEVLAFHRDSSGQVASTLRQAQGPLNGVLVQRLPVPNQPNQWVHRLIILDASNQEITSDFGQTFTQFLGRYWFLVRRQDGQSDNCGDRPGQPIPPSTPPSNVVPVNIVLGGQQVNIPVTLPNIVIENGEVVSFEPVFQIGPVEVTINPDSFDFEWPDTDINLPGDRTTGGTPEGTINNIQTTIQNTFNNTEITNDILNEFVLTTEVQLNNILNEIEECCENKTYTVERQTLSLNTTGDRYNLPENCVAVRIEAITPFTSRTPGYVGPGNTENVNFWGWFSVGYVDGTDGVRNELVYADSTFPVFEGAKTCTVAPKYQNRARVYAYYKLFSE